MQSFIHHEEVVLPADRGTVFDFFSNAANLQELTPDWIEFKILTPQPIHLHQGTLIDYQLRIHGIPIRWRTEILRWNPPHSFVDTQILGPYTRWVHEHRFEPVPGGTRMIDHVEYRPPGGWLINRLFVRRDVQRIFNFRRETLVRRFGGARSAMS